jgi:hypothetical protein
MQRPGSVRLLTFIIMLALTSACGTTTPGGSIIKTASGVNSAAPFANVLVISVAGNFPTRVQFEQQLVAAISGDDAAATAYYTVVGRNANLSRGILDAAVKARGFDAIILTRLKGQDRADLVANRPTGRLFDLYLYDYEELNIPADIPIGSTVAFVVEAYDTVLKKKIWAIESLIFDTDNVEFVVTEQAAAIAAEILQDDLVRLK